MIEKANFSYEDFIFYQKNVSRETFSRLECYIQLLQKWQRKINLISTTTINNVWLRHVIDSSQLFCLIDVTDHVVDIGSGAGFPGLVLAIMGIPKMTLIEQDTRKAAFLKEAARVTGTDINILNEDVKNVSLKGFSVITARAFAPVDKLLNILKNDLTSSNKLLLMKGKNYRAEIDEARKYWTFDYQIYPSVTEPEGAILSLTSCQKQGG